MISKNNLQNTLRISIVIPVYNEADRLGACLEAIASQTVKPYEVIVVDNNSTDHTVLVAGRYPFVKLLKQARQGVVHARNTGFDAASGNIIGRIDADTIIDRSWVATTERIFADSTIDSISGAVSYYDVPAQELSGKIDLFFRSRIARGMDKQVFLYGANMAMRRSVWRKVRSSVCLGSGLHEDFDLAIHMFQAGFHNTFQPTLLAAVSLRRFNSSANDFWSYVWLNPKTYAVHGLTKQRHMYPACLLVIVFYLPLRLLHQGFDVDRATFSWRTFLAATIVARVNPATFVD